MTAIELLEQLRERDLDWFKLEWAKNPSGRNVPAVIAVSALDRILFGTDMTDWYNTTSAWNACKDKPALVDQAIRLLKMEML